MVEKEVYTTMENPILIDCLPIYEFLYMEVKMSHLSTEFDILLPIVIVLDSILLLVK